MKPRLKISLWQIGVGVAFVCGSARAGNSQKLFHADEILLSGRVGVVGSELITQGDQSAYFDPVSKARPLVEPTYGFTAEARWNWVSLSVGGWYERVGQTSNQTTVEFPNNPFPHELVAAPWIDYLVLPLEGGFGAAGKRQSFFVQAGVYAALEEGNRIAWQVDGGPYSGAPMPTIEDGDTGWIMGLEYTLRLPHGCLLVNVDTRSSFSTVATDMNGSTRVATVAATLGYGFSL